MKLKSKLMAAAVALAASASANAAFQDFPSENSSLAFFAVDNTGAAKASTFIDLTYNFNDFLPLASTAGTHIVWDFNTNSLTLNGNAQAAGNWSSAFTTFTGAATPGDVKKWGVIAGDSFSAGGVGDFGYLSTSTSTLATIKSQGTANLAGFNLANPLITAANGALDGDASTATSSGAANFVGSGTKLGAALNFQGKASFLVAANEGVSQGFYLVDNSLAGAPAAGKAGVTDLGGTFSYAAGVLTYDVAAAPIPEPETYALLLAGLGMLGFMARRRLGNHA